MSKFINLVNGALSINTYRAPQAAATDIADIAEAITTESPECLTCSIDGSEIDVLEDGGYWQGSNVSQESLELLHSLINGI